MKTKVLEIQIEPHYKLLVSDVTGEVVVYSFSSKSNGKKLSVHIGAHGYLRVKINNRSTPVHQIIGGFLFGKKKDGYTINHKDGNKINNSPSNLEYITISENIKHAVRLGLHVSSDPRRSGRYKDGRAVKMRIKQYKHEWYLRNKFKKYAEA